MIPNQCCVFRSYRGRDGTLRSCLLPGRGQFSLEWHNALLYSLCETKIGERERTEEEYVCGGDDAEVVPKRSRNERNELDEIAGKQPSYKKYVLRAD